MPWTAQEAHKFTKNAKTSKQRRQWSHVANAMLKSGKSEGAAIRAANAAVGDVGWTSASRTAAAQTKKSGSEETPTNTDPSNPTPPPDQHLGAEEVPKKKKKPSLKRDPESYGEETADKRRKKIQARDPFGREVGTYEEEDGMSDLFETVGDAAYSEHLSMRDAVELDDAAKVHIKRDGYLAANPRIARTGIQIYAGDEVGRPDTEVIRVYRPANQVFARDAAHSYTHLPVTLDHPGEMVTADNWKRYAIGETGDEPLRDGESIRVPMMLRDAAAISAVKEGQNQLSVGYECDLAWTPGITEDGDEYDAVQSNIRANHLAVVTNARGGEQLKIGDDGQRGDSAMNLKNVMVDGIECQMTDTAAALVQKTIKTLSDSYDKLSDEFDAFKKKKDKDDEDCKDSMKKSEDAVKAKDAEIAVLNKKLADAEVTPQKLDAMVSERQGVTDKARAILGDKLVVKDKALHDIRKQVVDAHLGDVAKDWDTVQVTAGFAAITKDAKPASQNTGNQFADAVRAFAQPMHPVNVGDAEAIKQRAYDEMVKDGQEAWKRLGQASQ